MAAPTHSELAAFLGREVSAEQALTSLQVITSMAKAYTRDQGFANGEPNDEISSVILTAAARLVSNARGLLMDETEGPASVSYRSAFTGWTVADLFVLNRYRVRAL